MNETITSQAIKEILGRNPLKSGQCFLLGSMFLTQGRPLGQVAIPSNRVNVSYFKTFWFFKAQVEGSRNPLKSGQCFLLSKPLPEAWKGYWFVAIPSNRVNVSYFFITGRKRIKFLQVAIPSNRVNVSYIAHRIFNKVYEEVAIPSNRVNVSYLGKIKKQNVCQFKKSQSPQIGSMFLTLYHDLGRNCRARNWSQSPQIGSMFLTNNEILDK